MATKSSSAATKVLVEASGKMAERVYAQQAEAAGAEEAAGDAEADAQSKAGNDDIVDAEFEEVNAEKEEK